jgi:hypothetical protein
MLNGATKKGHSKKLQPIYVGPYLVTHKISDILYQIQGRRGKERRVIHHDRLKLCKDRDLPLWIHRDRKELLSSSNQESVYEDMPSLESLFPDDEATNPSRPSDGISQMLLEDPEDESSEDDTHEEVQTRGNDPSDTSVADDVSSQQLLLPGTRRNDPNNAGPRRMTRPSRPPVWLKDYVYRVLRPNT